MTFALPTPSLTMARSLPQGVDELVHMTPFDLFKSQLDTGSTEAKVDAMKRAKVVALAIGRDSTLQQLIPFFTNVTMKQPPHEDEVLMVMAQQLSELVPILLNTTDDCVALLNPLERLLAVEETVVRDEAVKTCNHIVPHINNNSSLVSMATRLVGAEWFTPRVSAAAILPGILQQTKDMELRFLFKELVNDETPMVRRSAAKYLGQFMFHLDNVKDMVPLLQQLCGDTQDSVRLLAVQSLKDADLSNPTLATQVYLPILKSGSTDLSWYV
jgi:serine/threonine-protein phosphatase 2A regulatory subunit A